MLKFISGNKNKYKEIKWLLAPFKVRQLSADLDEIQDLDPHEVIRHKLNEAFKHQKDQFFVEDTSLVFLGINKTLPGTFIRFFLDELGDLGLYKLASRLKNQNFEMRTIIGYAKSKGETHFFEGKLAGTIVKPIGNGGFGLDPILKPAGQTKTLGQLKALNKFEMSTRFKATMKFKKFLLEYERR